MLHPIDRRLGRARGVLAAAALALTLGTAACSSTNASAQSQGAATQTEAPASPGSGGAAGARANRRFGQILLSLGLSDDQKDQIRKIMADARSQARTQTDPQARRATMRAAFQKVQGVLTPDQRDALKAKLQAARNGRP